MMIKWYFKNLRQKNEQSNNHKIQDYFKKVLIKSTNFWQIYINNSNKSFKIT